MEEAEVRAGAPGVVSIISGAGLRGGMEGAEVRAGAGVRSGRAVTPGVVSIISGAGLRGGMEEAEVRAGAGVRSGGAVAPGVASIISGARLRGGEKDTEVEAVGGGGKSPSWAVRILGRGRGQVTGGRGARGWRWLCDSVGEFLPPVRMFL